MGTYFKKLIVRLHILYIFNTHVRFHIVQILFIIRSINLTQFGVLLNLTQFKFLLIEKFQTNLTNGNSKNQLNKFLSDRVFVNVVFVGFQLCFFCIQFLSPIWLGVIIGEREKWGRNGRGGYLVGVENGEARYFAHSSSPFGVVRT